MEREKSQLPNLKHVLARVTSCGHTEWQYHLVYRFPSFSPALSKISTPIMQFTTWGKVPDRENLSRKWQIDVNVESLIYLIYHPWYWQLSWSNLLSKHSEAMRTLTYDLELMLRFLITCAKEKCMSYPLRIQFVEGFWNTRLMKFW